MKLNDYQMAVMSSFALLGSAPNMIAEHIGEEQFNQISKECRNFGLLAEHHNELRVTGFGAAMLVQNGYRGTLENVVPVAGRAQPTSVPEIFRGNRYAEIVAGTLS